MRKRSQAKPSRQRARQSQRSSKEPQPIAAPAPAGKGFLQAFAALICPRQWEVVTAGTGIRRGPKANLPLPQFLMGLVYHFFSGRGSLCEHLRQLLGIDYTDSAASQRRQALPWEVFARLMRITLRPLAQRKKHPEAYYKRWRLVATDGVQFSLNNSPGIKQECRKAQSRRGRAAFAKMGAAVLLEVGLHNPLAAAMGRHGESEGSLAAGLLAQLPGGCLLLADRLYGYAGVLASVLDRCRAVKSEFLVRVQSGVDARVIQRLGDGSGLVEVQVRQKGNSHQIVGRLLLREIRVMVQRGGSKAEELRLWTSILDWRQAPAMELAKLYTQRWEQELYFRQLKHELRRSERLQSQTVETAAQEISAWIISSALIARERARAAQGALPVLRVSFVKLVELLRPLWLVLSLGADLLSPKQQQELTDRFLKEAQRCVTPKRRTRSCPRAVRQPIRGWPRLKQNRYCNEPVRLTLLPAKR